MYKDNPQTNGKWWAQTKPGNWLPHFTILPRIGSYSSGQISVSPFIGRNDGDGLLPGVVLMSDLVPQRKFKWILAPLYGLGSHKLRGYAEGRLITNIKNSIFDKFLISSSVNYFGYSRDTHYLFRDSYLKLSPSVALRATPNNNHPHVTQWWKYRWVNIHQYYGRGLDFESKEFVEEQREYAIHELAYQLRSDFILRPFTFRSDVQAGKGFVRLNFNFQQHFIGRNTYKGLWVHAYAGYQPIRDQPVASTYFTLSGISSYGFYSTDYMFDQWLGGRNKNSGIFSRQIFLKDAGFKTLATNGISEEGMIAAGFSWALPAPVFHLYMDAAAYKSGVTEKNVISYSGGLAVVLLKDVFEIYVPLLESKDIRESLSYEVRNIWHKRISFQANFKLLNPIDVADRLTLRY